MVFYRAKFLRYGPTDEGTTWYALAAHHPGEEAIWLNVKGSADPAVIDEAIKRAEDAFARGEIKLSIESPYWRAYTSAYVNLPAPAPST